MTGIDYLYLAEVDAAVEICNLREVWVMPSTNETLSPWGEGMPSSPSLSCGGSHAADTELPPVPT